MQWAKRFLRNQMRSRGWDFVRGPNLNGFLEDRAVDYVIDAGANKGDYGDHLRRWGYKGRILSIEPATAPFTLLERRIAQDTSWSAVQVALGSEPGEAEINLSQDERFNSFLATNKKARTFDPKSGVVGTEKVRIDTLDTILQDQHPFWRPFLKIDTQGFERQVLGGAGDLLRRCQGVQLELPIVHLYDGVWSFREALEYMESAGFILAQTTPTNVFPQDKAAVVELDCVFRRRDERD